MEQIKNIIATKNAPAAIGPYSQAVCVGGLVFLSGQLAIDLRHRQPGGGRHSGSDRTVPEEHRGHSG